MRTLYTIKYRVKKYGECIQERLRWSKKEAEILENTLKSLDYIEYLGTSIDRIETNELKNQVENILDFTQEIL